MQSILPGILIGILLSLIGHQVFKNYSTTTHPDHPTNFPYPQFPSPYGQPPGPSPFALPPATPLPPNNTNLCLDYPPYLKTVWAPEGRMYIFVDIIADLCNWRVLKVPHNATLIWTTTQADMAPPVLRRLRLGNGQIWNQLIDGWHFADKSRLHRLLKSINHLEFQPETYILTEPDECTEFFKSALANPNKIWVTKPPASSQGDGIIVNPSIDTLLETWRDPTSPSSDQIKCRRASREDILVQQYILNPLLLEGKKMEIRSYWVIASTHPLVVLYHDGTVRLTTQNYKEGDWDNPLIHITNTKQQKKADPNYYNTEQERKWSLEQLAAYLSKEGKIEGSQEEWLNQLREQFKERLAVAVLGAYPVMIADRAGHLGWDGRYELFGMDILLDDNLYPWLTELQMSPGLSRDPGVKEHVIPALLQEMIDAVLEIDTTIRLRREKLPFPLNSLKDWQQIDMTKYLQLVPEYHQKLYLDLHPTN